MKRFLTILLAVFMVTSLLAGCAKTKSAGKSEKIKIVTTVFPLYDFARQIAGDKAEVTMLLPPGAESHSFEPTPKDIIKIQNCDLFLYIGGESESWVADVLKSMDKPVKSLALIDTVEKAEEKVVEGMQTESQKDSEEGKVEYDEHIWTSPKNAEAMSLEIAAAMCDTDEANTGTYDKNSTEYLKMLEGLDNSFKDFFGGVKTKTLVFGDRFPFRYFTDEYGLNYYAAFPGCSSETEPSAATLAFLINKVKSEKIGTVFYLEFSNHLVADNIAESTGAKTALLHSCHNVSSDEIAKGATYISLMQQNLETLKGALK